MCVCAIRILARKLFSSAYYNLSLACTRECLNVTENTLHTTIWQNMFCELLLLYLERGTTHLFIKFTYIWNIFPGDFHIQWNALSPSSRNRKYNNNKKNRRERNEWSRTFSTCVSLDKFSEVPLQWALSLPKIYESCKLVTWITIYLRGNFHFYLNSLRSFTSSFFCRRCLAIKCTHNGTFCTAQRPLYY